MGIFGRALLACLLCGCTGQAATPAYDLRVEGRSVMFRGEIRGEAAAALARTLRDPGLSIDRLVITSPGGEGPAGIAVGEIVRDRRLDVQVNGFCISACANFVFVAARHKTISPHSIVSFHVSPSLMGELFRRSERSEAADRFADHDRAVGNFYRSLGIDRTILGLTGKMMQPLCVAEDRTRPPEDPNRYMIAWRNGGFIPSRAQLAMAGINNVEGWWPQEADLPLELRRLGFRSNYRPAYDPGGARVRIAMSSDIQPVPACPPALIAGSRG